MVVIAISAPGPGYPEIEKLTLSPSASVAVTVPIAVWFSSALKDAEEVKDGKLSFKLLISTVIF